jgi:hypothetical protein
MKEVQILNKNNLYGQWKNRLLKERYDAYLVENWTYTEFSVSDSIAHT